MKKLYTLTKLFLILFLMGIGISTFGQTALSENFDAGVLPTGWTSNSKVDGTGTKVWLYTNTSSRCATSDHTSGTGKYAMLDDYNIQATENPVNLTTKSIDLSSGSYKLEFYAWIGSGAGTDPIKVDISTDDGANWTSNIYTVTKTVTGLWVKHSVDLSAYNTATVKIRFKGYSVYAMSNNNSGIDDIKVFVPKANDLSVKSLSVSPTTITAGTSTTITANIENTGSNSQTDVVVTFKYGSNSIGTATITSIAPGEVKQAQQTWTSIEGNHTLYAEVASDDENSNNSNSLAIVVYPTGALIEGFEGTWLPTSWSINPTTSSWSQATYSYYEGTKCAYISASTGDKRLITPKLTITGSSSISFYAMASSLPSTLKLQYSTDKTSWTDVTSASYTLTSTHAQYTANLGTIPAGNYFIAFVYNASYKSTFVDKVIGPAIAVEAPAPAITPNPANAATGINTTAALSWALNGSGGIPTGYKVFLGTDGDGTATPTSIVNGTLQTGTTFTPSTPLAYSTTYYWQIIPTNSVGDATSCPIWSFTTMADPTQPIPYSQNFESGTTPTAWTLTNFSVQTYGAAASKSLSVDMSYLTSAAAVTCPIGPAVPSTQISFDYRFCVPTYSGYPQQGYALTASDKIDVKVSTDGGANYTTVYTINQASHTTSTEFATKYITLDGTYDTKNVTVKLEATKGGTAFQVDIDNLLVRETPTVPACVVDKTSVDFGYKAVGVQPSSKIKITNTGGGSLTVNSGDITITGANADQFAFDDPSFPILLGAGESKIITVKFVATIGGVKTANLSIAHNATGSPSSITLTGEAYMPVASFTEGFETTAIDLVPKGWSNNYTGYAFAGVTTTASAAHSGTNSMSLSKWGTDLVTLATPAVTNFSTNRLKLWVKSSAASTSLSIGTMSDPANPATYVEFKSQALTTAYAEYIVDFTTYTGTDKFIAIKTPTGASNPTIQVDDIVWEAIPTTPLLGLGATTINFGMVPAKNTSLVNLVVSNAGVGTLTVNATDLVLSGTDASEFTIGSTTFPLSLAANATANVELVFQPQTAGDKTATLTVSHNGTNPSGVVTLSGKALPKGSLVETFNATTFPTTGWTAQTGWVRQTYAAYEGAGHAYISPTSTATDVKLITPQLVIASGDILSFYTKTTASSPYPTLKVMYASSTSGPWTQIGSTITVGSSYVQNQVDLTSIAGSNYYLAFAVSSSSYKATYLDMVMGPVVYVPNVAPAFISTAITTGKVGQSYSYSITATDSNNDNLAITAPTKPAWLSITDNGNGTATLSGTPTVAGDYNVSLAVNDGTVTTNQDFTINVAPETTYAVNFNVVGSNGTLTADVNLIAISSGDLVVEGKDVIFTATPTNGYKVKEWKNNTVVVSDNTTNTYTLSNLSAAATVTVEFEPITYSVNFNVVGANGTLDAIVDASTITTGAQVVEGKSVVFNASPASGYRVKEWKNNTVVVSGNTTNTYTLSNLSAAATVTVEFEPITYAVDFSVIGSNGTIAAVVDANAITSGSQVIEGKNVVFTATPDNGYRVKEWKLNSAVVNGNTSNTYTLNSIASSATVSVEFEAIPPTTYTVNFSVVGANGSISATVDGSAITSGSQVIEGKTVVFTATPNANYKVKEWKNNSSVVVGNTTNTLTISNLSAASTATVEFELSTGIDDNSLTKIEIYPNPFNSFIKIKGKAEISKIEVSNIIGQIQESIYPNNQESQINTENLKIGVYIVRIVDVNGNITTRKMIKR